MRHFRGILYTYIIIYTTQKHTKHQRHEEKEKKQEVHEECKERENVQRVVLCVWFVYGASNLAFFFSYPFCVMSPKKRKKTQLFNTQTLKHDKFTHACYFSNLR